MMKVQEAAKIEASRIDHVNIIQVIEVRYNIGMGTNEDPVRQGIAHFTMDGELIHAQDTMSGWTTALAATTNKAE